jgi:hypothetical protein
LIYVLPSLDVEPHPHEIPSHYQKFKCVWEEICGHVAQTSTIPIHLVERTQPPFKPIYTLLQDKLAMLCEYFNENLKKEFIWHSKFQVGAPILFVKKKEVICECMSIIVDWIDSPSRIRTFCP